MREQWRSHRTFIAAAVGSAVGLGNIWAFPYKAGTMGGAVFILPYLFFVLVVATVLVGEILIGRAAQRSPVGAFKELTSAENPWRFVGGLGVVTGFIILSFYSVVGGWCLGYVFKTLTSFGQISNEIGAKQAFGTFTSSPGWSLLCHAGFMLSCIGVVIFGIKRGLQRCNNVLMPSIILILVILAVRALSLPGAFAGLDFMWRPDFSKLSWGVILEAMGHSCFTVSVGMGAMIAYGSYLKKDVNVPKAAIWIAITDTAIALLAGLAIFPAVFAMGASPAKEEGLVFETLPYVFGQIPGGRFLAFGFFVMLTMAALTSAISLLETVVAYFVDEKRWLRKKATILMGVIIFLVGVPSCLSVGGPLAGYKLFGKTFLQLVYYLSSNIMLPLGALLIALFVGWRWRTARALEEFNLGAFKHRSPVGRWWLWATKYVAAPLVLIVLIAKILEW